MGTIVVSTATDGFLSPGSSHMRSADNDELIVIVKKTSGALGIFSSTNAGTSWTDKSADLSRSNLQEWSGIDVDEDNHVHICYRVYESGKDRIFYRRWRRNGTGYTLESEVLVREATAASAGAVYQGLDLLHLRVASQSWYVPVAVGVSSGGSRGVIFSGMRVYKSGSSWTTVQATTTVFGGNRTFVHTGSAARVQPSISRDSTPTPNLWLSYGRSGVYVVRIPWNASTKRWIGPTGDVLVGTHTTNSDISGMRLDGTRSLIPILNGSQVTVVERNKTNTSQVERVSPTHTTGVVRNCVIVPDPTTGDFRLYAIGTSTGVIYYVDFSRAGSSWGSWTSLAVTPVAITTWGVRQRRGVHLSDDPGRYDVYHGVSSGGNTYASTAQSVNYAPLQPTWNLGSIPKDVALGLVLPWTFRDSNPADTQGSYALRRQIGAGAFAYWRASDQTWQATEQINVSAVQSATIPVGWGADGDATHNYWVKTLDAAGLASVYSDARAVVPTTSNPPTITQPASASTWTFRYLDVTWTNTQQTNYRVRVVKDNLTLDLVHDSGWIPDDGTTGQYITPAIFEDNTNYRVRVHILNNENYEAIDDNAFTVDFVPPPTPTLTVTPNSTAGTLDVQITNPAPTGLEPALLYNDLYRRPVGDTSDGVFVATNLGDDASFSDFEVASGVDYEYRVLAIGVNETQAYSAWTD